VTAPVRTSISSLASKAATGAFGRSEPSGRSRNDFLDAVRTVALLRVVVWHTYGYAWISYFIASMPAMFFVAGSLVVYSLQRAGPANVLYRRFRRILIPLWVMGSVAILVMAAYDQSNGSSAATFDFKEAVWWLFPLWDPTGSEWGLTWWAPLWYLRCVTWLFLATPLLLWAWRRTGPALMLVPVLALGVMELIDPATASVPWQLQDAALYGFFWLLGFAYHDGWLSRFGSRMRLVLAATFAALAGAWALTQDVPAGIVNSAYPLQLFVGLAWLFAALAFEDLIGRIAAGRSLSPVIYWINERALTIYLWQSAGLFVMYQLLWARDRSETERVLLALPIVASVTFSATLMFGWVEDLAAGRGARLWPLRQGSIRLPRPWRALAAASAVAGLACVLLAARDILSNPSQAVQATAHTVPASGAGLHLRAEQIEVETQVPEAPANAEPQEAISAQELQAELEVWLSQWKIAGATLTLQRTSGEAWSGAAGTQASGEPFAVGGLYEITSVTKTFTAALILRLMEAGRLNLEDPVSMYVPEFPGSGRYTIRELLQHTSGLSVGSENPYDGLVGSARDPLAFQPGTAYLYSRSGYYLLGLVIEAVLREPYTVAVERELLQPLGLHSTRMDEELVRGERNTHPYAPSPGGGAPEWLSGAGRTGMPPGAYFGNLWSSGGLWSSTQDLAYWAIALWADEQVLSRDSVRQMTTFLGKEFDYTGLGTYPFCPCWEVEGRLSAERWGFAGVNGLVEYDRIEGVALAVHLGGTIFDPGVVQALDDLSLRFRNRIRGHALP
jgi:CubicO group peptidase (beta-lactamase class C family)/peptidoglycan/LPS O-acetylase OafA/YrhL